MWFAPTYFADADADALPPAGLTVQHWEEIKLFFTRNAGRLLSLDPSPAAD